MTFPQSRQGNEFETEARLHLSERDRERHDRHGEAVAIYSHLKTSKEDIAATQQHLEDDEIQWWARAEGDKYPDEIRSQVIQSCVDCVNKILEIRADRRAFQQMGEIAEMSYRQNGECS